MVCPAQAQARAGQTIVVYCFLTLMFHFSNQILQYF